MKRMYLVLLAVLVGAAAVIWFRSERAENDTPARSGALERSKDAALDESPRAPVWEPPTAPASHAHGAYELSESIEAPRGTALEVVGRLRPLAESGDARAALLMFLKLQECYSLPDPQAQSVQAGLYAQAGASEKALADAYDRHRAECESSSSLLASRGQWLEQAAAAGDEQAQLLYASVPEAVLGEEADMLRNPEKVAAYKAASSRYLHQLASQGSLDAMIRLAGSYDAGVMLPRDAIRSYAYYRAMEMAKPGVIPRRLMDAQRAKIPQGRAAEAEQLASKIYASCCNR